MTTAERIAAAVAAMQAILDHEETGDIIADSPEAQDAILALAHALDGLVSIETTDRTGFAVRS
jgi:hypothetical protein